MIGQIFGHPYPGKYFTFEGGEGGGKTTQLKLLIERLKLNYPGREIVSSREPGGPVVSEAIREILHNRNNIIDSRTEALLFAAARRQFLLEKVKPVLEKGGIFLADRSFVSSLAYQGYGRGLGVDYVLTINKDIIAGLAPDLVILFDLDPRIGLKRKQESGEELTRLDLEELPFHQRVREGYLEIAQDYKDYIKVIDASLSREAQAELIWHEIIQSLGENIETRREILRGKERG